MQPDPEPPSAVIAQLPPTIEAVSPSAPEPVSISSAEDLNEILKKEIVELRAKVQALQLENEGIAEKNADMKEEITELEKYSDDLWDEAEGFRKQMMRAREIGSEWNKRHLEAHKQLEKGYEKELEFLKNRNAVLEGAVGYFRQQVEIVEGENKKLKTELNEHRGRENELETESGKEEQIKTPTLLESMKAKSLRVKKRLSRARLPSFSGETLDGEDKKLKTELNEQGGGNIELEMEVDEQRGSTIELETESGKKEQIKTPTLLERYREKSTRVKKRLSRARLPNFSGTTE